MRVLQVHNRHRVRGGEDEVVEDERRLLVDAGHAVASFVIDNPTGRAASVGSLLRAPWNPRAAEAVVRAATSHEADVVHVHNTWFALSPAVFESLAAAGWPMVASLHNFRTTCINALLLRDGRPCDDCVGRQPVPGIVHRCYRGSLTLSAVAASTIVVARRRRIWEQCGATYLVLDRSAVPPIVAGGVPADRVVVRPNFAPDPGDRDRPPSSSGDVVYAGRLSQEKGIAVLLTAWSRATVPGLRLHVFGDGPLRSALEAMSVPGVTFHGAVDRARLTAAYLTARALVFPSVCREAGLPRAPIEAAAAGIPVLMSDAVGAVHDIVGSGAGWSAPAGDASALVRSLEHLSDPVRVDEAGTAARRLYEVQHAPGPALRSLETAYESAIDRARSRQSSPALTVNLRDDPR